MHDIMAGTDQENSYVDIGCMLAGFAGGSAHRAVILPCRQAQDTLYPGRQARRLVCIMAVMDQKNSYVVIGGMIGWFCWWLCTSRCASFPVLQGQDALCLPGRQHPCHGAEAFSMVADAPVMLVFPSIVAGPCLSASWSVWPRSSSCRQWHGYCWYAGYDAFALCSLRRQARGVSTGAVCGHDNGHACRGSTTGVAVQTVLAVWRWTSLCCRSDKFQLLVLKAGMRGRVHRDTVPIIRCTVRSYRQRHVRCTGVRTTTTITTTTTTTTTTTIQSGEAPF